MAVPADLAAKANRVYETYDRQVKSIRANPDLTPQAKQKHMARVLTSAKSQMQSMQQGWEDQKANRQKTLARDLFGATGVSGADAISMRDALDRASQLENADDAATLLRRAQNTGDTVLEGAIAQHAMDNLGNIFTGGPAWAGVLDAFAETRPHTADRLQELIDGEQSNVSDNFRAAAQFSLVKPSELSSVADHTIEAMAAEE